MSGALLLDVLIALLLVATIAYAVVLNKRLSVLRDGKDELRATILKFNKALEQAHKGTVELNRMSEQSVESLQNAVKDAKALQDELAFLVERGTMISDRLNAEIKQNRVRAVDDVPEGMRRPTLVSSEPDFYPSSREGPVSEGDQEGISEEVERNLRKILAATR